jgi:hypothetical protein
MTLKRIGPLSAAKLSGILYALMGLIIGALFSIASLLGSAFDSVGIGGGFLFGIGAIIILPIFYGLLGLISGLIGAALFNLVAGIVGGLELEFDQ